MSKPILCFIIGYIPDINNKKTKNTYGSEVALVKLSEIFSEEYQVIIFGDSIYNETIVNNVEYLNIDKFKNFQNNYKIDITIISRYISTFLNINIKSRKIFLWVHDIYPIPFYKSIRFPNESKSLFKNIINKIDGVVTLTQWHKQHTIDFYDIDESKIHIIGNGIEPNIFKNNIKKQKNKFIWSSHGYRGIDIMLDYFHIIKKEIVDAELYIYRDITAFSDYALEEMKKYNYFHYGGKISNDDIIKEFQSSDVWFYPTNFEETYCISALEAQMAKCFCISSHLGGLIETVSDRGILLKEPIYSSYYKDKMISETIKVLKDDKLKKEYQEKGYKWAKEQSWKNRSKKWYEMFNK